jgi:hypothetical protein
MRSQVGTVANTCGPRRDPEMALRATFGGVGGFEGGGEGGRGGGNGNGGGGDGGGGEGEGGSGLPGSYTYSKRPLT